MKLKFDANQEYQLDAINSIVDIFEGQPLEAGDFEVIFEETSEDGFTFKEGCIANRLSLSEEQILKNVQSIQKKNSVEVSKNLDGYNFSVEMETGTGKTYVYLRTMCELNKKYGFKKFVIVVPSLAIKEGVIKNLEITREHFEKLYSINLPLDAEYNSTKISKLHSFALSNCIEIIVINIDSFTKDENIINKRNDKLSGEKPINFIRNTSPIVIIDEPQNMETEKRKKAIDSLNPLFTLRYSATHKNFYNLMYSLNPVKAYKAKLVKQIEVDSVVAENSYNQAYISVDSFKANSRTVSATITIDVNTDKGVQRKKKTIDRGNLDLYKLSCNREIYNGLYVENIDVGSEFVEFSDGSKIYKGESRGGVNDDVMKIQIRKTVEEHKQKEDKYKNIGVKVLSLFFIDRVANYRAYDENKEPVKGKFAQWFEEAYKEVYKNEESSDSVDKVHNGYFAQDKGLFKDTGGESQPDNDAYNLIMKDKERLLDINEPLRFIFSHSALREGWDNPNVFQICTLNETKSEMKKRQEIGRGLRLAVNQNGERVFNEKVNVLTVIANECYEDFAKQLQNEIEDECGVSFEGMAKNKNGKISIKYRKGFELDERFLDIWNRIKEKTRYRVEYSTKDLIEKTAKAIEQMEKIETPKIVTSKIGIKIDEEGVKTEMRNLPRYEETNSSITNIPNPVAYIKSKTELSSSTVFEILEQSNRIEDMRVNAQLFLDRIIEEIKKVLNELMIDGIRYEKTNQFYDMGLFDDSDWSIYSDSLYYELKNNDKTIFEKYIPVDSDTVEKQFACDCEANEDVEFYFKLPSKFQITTPIGMYNPDWAVVLKGEKRVYFVAETKYNMDYNKLRPEEVMRIKCGIKNYKEFEDVEYRHVTSLADLK